MISSTSRYWQTLLSIQRPCYCIHYYYTNDDLFLSEDDRIDVPSQIITFELGVINVTCQVVDQSQQASYRWTKLGDSDFEQIGPNLEMSGIMIDDGGEYVCNVHVTSPVVWYGTASCMVLIECKSANFVFV